MILKKLDEYLRRILKINEISDISMNGLQIGNQEQNIDHIALAVDASLQTMIQAKEHKADLLLVHHGLFWGKPFALAGPDYQKVELLVKNNIGLYAVHLPLDLHFPLGNNYQIASHMELKNIVQFGNYHGTLLGYGGETEWSMDKIVKKCEQLSSTVKKLFFNDRPVKKIAIVSGKGGFDILEDYIASDYDLLITGELEHSLYNAIADHQINVIGLGHYESEKYGVIALGDHLKKNLGLNCFFLEQKTGF